MIDSNSLSFFLSFFIRFFTFLFKFFVFLKLNFFLIFFIKSFFLYKPTTALSASKSGYLLRDISLATVDLPDDNEPVMPILIIL